MGRALFRSCARLRELEDKLKGSALAVVSLTLVLSACATQQQSQSGNAQNQPVQQNPAATAQMQQNQQALIEAQQADDQKQEDARLKQAKGEQEKAIHLGLVQKMIDQNNGYAALAHLDSYDKKWGADLKSRLLRADALRKTGQFDQAEQAYQSLLGTTDNQGQVWYGLGKISIEKGKLNAAEVRLEKAVQIDPLKIEAYTDLGLVYLLDGKKDLSYNALMKASELSNQDPKILANLALWGLVFNDFDMSLDIANRLQWSDSTRNKVMAQANTIKKRIKVQGDPQ